MTERYSGFVVALTKDIREDDAEAVMVALKQIRGVLTVEPVTSDPVGYVTRERIKREISVRLNQMAREINDL